MPPGEPAHLKRQFLPSFSLSYDNKRAICRAAKPHQGLSVGISDGVIGKQSN
jgi:hypothetical protein